MSSCHFHEMLGTGSIEAQHACNRKTLSCLKLSKKRSRSLSKDTDYRGQTMLPELRDVKENPDHFGITQRWLGFLYSRIRIQFPRLRECDDLK